MRAATPLETYSAVYQGREFTFTHILWRSGARAIGVEDPAFGALLHKLGATMTWRPNARNVFITTAEPAVIAFSVGDRGYQVGRSTSQAAFAPFLRGSEAYVPLPNVLAGLSLAPVTQQRGRVHVLEPQITVLDVDDSGGKTTIIAFAGTRVRPRVVQRVPTRVTYEFDGVGSTLSGASSIGGDIRSVSVRVQGQAPEQRTFVTVNFAPSSPAGTGGTRVTGVDVIAGAQTFTIAVGTNGNATYAWHRLHAPDDRFWIDISGAHLAVPARQDVWIGGPVKGVRVTQFAPAVVRIALSLAAKQTIAVIPATSGVRVVVGDAVVASAPMSGSGTIGEGAVARVAPAPTPTVASVAIAPTTTPAGGERNDQQDLISPPGWKFGPRQPYAPTNPHLIVIDPGHGGSDPGTIYRGVMEKTLTLDIATRLRDILVARGWQVRMTRTRDVDVYAPDDSARDELQARDNIANNAGARLFISIHVNACCGTPDPTPSGTTTYYSKPEDVALAADVERAIVQALGTTDDGIVKSRMYVTLHALMPAVLVETAFITNPTDFVHLTSPQWRQHLAEAIADGIEAYARENPVPMPAASSNQ